MFLKKQRGKGMEKKVSIIIPVYKVEKYIRKCLDSLLEQTYKKFVVYLVNDGSPDGSGKILAEYKNKYPELFTIIDKQNGGLSSARNIALQYVTTEYIMFIDSDDYVHKKYVELLVENAEKYNADIVECGYSLVDEEYSLLKNIRPKLSGINYVQEHPDVICDILVEACGKIYKSALFLENNISYPEGLIYEDTATTPRLVARSKTVVSIEDCLYYYLQRQGSIMSQMDSRMFQLYEIADLLNRDPISKKYMEQFEYCRINRILILIQKIINLNGSNREIYKAYDYLESNIPNWRVNRVFIEKTRSSNFPTKLYRYFVVHKCITLMKIAIKIKIKRKGRL